MILCGDFNCQIDTNNKGKSVSVLKKILKTFCFKDCCLSGGKTYEQGLTCCNGDNVPQSRIDCVFTSEQLSFPMNNIFLRKAPNIDNNRFTDHLGIFLELYTSIISYAPVTKLQLVLMKMLGWILKFNSSLGEQYE